MVLETTKLLVTDEHTDNLRKPGKDEEFLHGNHTFHALHSEIQRIINSAILRYEEDTMKRQSDGILEGL